MKGIVFLAAAAWAGLSFGEGRPAELFAEAKYKGQTYEPGSSVAYTAYRMANAPSQDAAVYVLLEFNAKAMGPMFDKFAAEGLMPPGLVVCVSPGWLPPEVDSGSRWYLRGEEFDQPSAEYAAFLTKELVPAAAKAAGMRISDDPNLHFVAGGSSGGAAAWHLVWYGKGYFRRAYLASPTFSDVRGAEIAPYLIRKTESKPVRVYITLGDIEPDRHPGDSFAVGLAARSSFDYAGYPCRREYFPEGGPLAGKATEDVMRRMIEFTWRGWRKGPVEPLRNPPRVDEVIKAGTTWEPFEGEFPAAVVAQGAKGTYAVENGKIVFTDLAGVRKVVYDGSDTVTAVAFGKDDGRLFASDLGRRFVLSFNVRKDGTLAAAYRHSPLSLPVDPKVLGAYDLAYFAGCNRLLAATELGVQGVHHFGATDVIIPLPDDLPATRVAVKDGWLYVMSGDKKWRREMTPNPPPQDTTAYACKGEHRNTAHLPFFKGAIGKRSVILDNFFDTPAGQAMQVPVPTGEAAAQAAANGDF